VRTTLWLTHHAVEEHHRCALVGNTLVCRRCLFSNPAAIVAAILSGFGLHWAASLDPLLLWLLPAPAIAEFVAEHTLKLPYNPKRQAFLSAIGGVAFGRGMARYLVDPGDRLFWSVSITYSLVMVGSAMYGVRRDRAEVRQKQWAESDSWWASIEAELDAGARNDGATPTGQFPTA
jgi:hypothetical protein